MTEWTKPEIAATEFGAVALSGACACACQGGAGAGAGQGDNSPIGS